MTTDARDVFPFGGAQECPECGGCGWVAGTDTRCCGGSDYECGGRGCTGPEPEQVQEQCEYCCGSGVISPGDDGCLSEGDG